VGEVGSVSIFPDVPDEATFEFEDGEVVMRFERLSTRRFLELNALVNDPEQWATEAGLATLAATVDEFRVSWTYEGDAMDRPFQFNRALLQAWLRGVGTIPVPLPSRRSGLATSTDES
jgi:hypothetical protein